ncbi:MAG: glycosyltransferase family 2 protein [Candidatus Chisholmbacteria bacterium]|nr:glycosyltransferase family 2 protein [Candidatus Chisholmbacteria bacterium]
MTYSWVIPIYNEAKSLTQLVTEINQFSRQPYEIIAVSDASTDNSLLILRRLSRRYPIKVISLPSRQGKWPALITSLHHAQGNIIITLDADLQDNPNQFTKLLTKLNQGYDLVSGWRQLRRDTIYKVWISRLGNWLVSNLTHRRFHDLNSPFKVFRRELLTSLPLTGSLFRFSLLFAYKSGFKVAEVPIRHRPRRFGESKFGLIKYLRIIYDLILVLLLFSGSNRIAKTK